MLFRYKAKFIYNFQRMVRYSSRKNEVPTLVVASR